MCHYCLVGTSFLFRTISRCCLVAPPEPYNKALFMLILKKELKNIFYLYRIEGIGINYDAAYPAPWTPLCHKVSPVPPKDLVQGLIPKYIFHYSSMKLTHLQRPL